MKFNLFLFSIAFLSAFALSSCDLTGDSSGGTQVNNPTVDQMTEMEKKWGVQPHTTRSSQFRASGGTDTPVPASGASPVQSYTPEPAPVPLPQSQAVVPPVFEPPPSATPDQIQKLKN